MKMQMARRTDTLEFYRGGRRGRWTPTWRNASILPEGFWLAFIDYKFRDWGIPVEYVEVDVPDFEPPIGNSYSLLADFFLEAKVRWQRWVLSHTPF